MFKKYLKIVFLFIMINLISCGGGGGGGHDYSGTWNVQGTLVRNGCPTNPQQGENYNIIVNQDGDDIVIFDGQNTFTGSTHGIDEYIENGFAAQHIFPNGLEDHIYVTHVEGDIGNFTEHFYIPISRGSVSGVSLCEITYQGRAQRISKNTKELETANNKFNIEF